MYLPPMGERVKLETIQQCFKVMNGLNQNTGFSRIKNVEGEYIELYKKMGFLIKEKSVDYIYDRKELASLKGDKFKSKRAGCNQFVKNYDFTYSKYLAQDKKECMALCRKWSSFRKNKNNEAYYGYLLEDTLRAQAMATDYFSKLDFIGRVVRINGKIQAYTFGYALGNDIFCVIFEVCNNTYKGLSQFIFREICREMEQFSYINAMDDSGLENLRKVKLSYKPVALVPSFSVTAQ